MFVEKSQHQFVVWRTPELEVEQAMLFLQFPLDEKGGVGWHPSFAEVARFA